jgi:hypothetical protein
MLFRWLTCRTRSALIRPGRRSRLHAEQLEDRTALSPLIPVTGHRDIVYDPYRSILDITTSNALWQYNLNNQSLVGPIIIGTNLASADITNDGNTLVVAEQQTNSAGWEVLHEINLNTLQRTDLTFPSGPGEGGWGLAMGLGSTGLLDDIVPGNYASPMRQFNLATGQMVFRHDDPGSAGNGGVGSATQIVHGADRSLMLITEGTVPYGPFFTYSPQTDTFSRQPYFMGTSLTNALTAVNRNGTLFAIQVNGTTTVFNANGQSMATLGGIDGGVAFDPGQDIMYGVSSGSGQIYAFNTSNWQVQYSMPVGETISRGTALGNGVMTVSNDGRWLFLATPHGVRDYPLPWGSGPAIKLSCSNLPVQATAGTPFSFTISALDSSGHVATGYVGTIHFISSDPQAVLPPDYTFLSSDLGTHTFTVTLKTAGQQTVNAYDVRGGPGTYLPPVQVFPGAVASFQLSTGSNNYQAAYYPFSVLVTAYDAYGNQAYNYLGKVHFTSTDPAAILPRDYTFTGSDQGRHPFSVTLVTQGPQTVFVTDTSKVPNPAKGSVTLNVLNYIPGLHFTFTASTTTPTAGAPFDLHVTAYDQYNQVAVHYIGTITFTTTDKGTGVLLPADYTFTAADAGTHTFTNGATLVTAGAQTISLYDKAYGTSGGGNIGGGNPGGPTYTTLNLTVLAGQATTLTLGGFPASVTAGTGGTFTVTAYDAYGNVATGYTGTLHFTSSDTQAALPADTTLTNGTGTFSATLKTAGTQGLIATDTANTALSGSETGIAVSPAAASTFLVAGFPSPVTAGTAASFSVTALDPYANVATGYSGTVHFSSSDGQATLPADATLTNGTGTFTATLKTAGSQSLTATDTANAALTGTQPSIAVSPAAAATLQVGGFPTSVTAGDVDSFTVTAYDAYGNVATGYTGTVHFTSSDGQAALPADATLTNGTGTFTATLKTAGTQSLTATDTTNSALSGSEGAITVSPAAASVLVLSGPSSASVGTPFSVTITMLDAYGNVATGYLGTVHFSSSDALAGLPSDYTFTAADAGIQSFSVTLWTAGSQSVTATDAANGLSGELDLQVS